MRYTIIGTSLAVLFLTQTVQADTMFGLCSGLPDGTTRIVNEFSYYDDDETLLDPPELQMSLGKGKALFIDLPFEISNGQANTMTGGGLGLIIGKPDVLVTKSTALHVGINTVGIGFSKRSFNSKNIFSGSIDYSYSTATINLGVMILPHKRYSMVSFMAPMSQVWHLEAMAVIRDSFKAGMLGGITLNFPLASFKAAVLQYFVPDNTTIFKLGFDVYFNTNHYHETARF